MSSTLSDAFDIVTQPIATWSEREVADLVGGRDFRFDRPSERDVSRGAPEIIRISTSLREHGFAGSFAALTQRLGEPDQIIGGPTQLRWWTRDTRQIILDTSPLMLSIVPAEWSTADEMEWVQVGEPDMAPYLWWTPMNMRKRLPESVWTPGTMEPESLADVRIEIERICRSLARAAIELPDELVRSGSFIVTSPEVRHWPTSNTVASGKPYKPRCEVVMVGEPWSIELTEVDGTGYDVQADGDPATDVPMVVERVTEAISTWGYEPSELRFDGYAAAQVPAKRGFKKVHRKVAFTTIPNPGHPM